MNPVFIVLVLLAAVLLKIANSLTLELIQKQKIDKWNGDVPKVQRSGSTIVDITK